MNATTEKCRCCEPVWPAFVRSRSREHAVAMIEEAKRVYGSVNVGGVPRTMKIDKDDLLRTLEHSPTPSVNFYIDSLGAFID